MSKQLMWLALHPVTLPWVLILVGVIFCSKNCYCLY